MRAKLPPVLGVDLKSRLGRVRQISVPTTTIDCSAVKYTLGKSVGHVLRDAAGANILYPFAARPKTTPLPNDAPVLLAKGVSVDQEELDLTEGTWMAHPAISALTAVALAAAASRSWHRAFQFAEEDPRDGVVGLRKPQVGALHAIHAHWSTSSEGATVVMPTGISRLKWPARSSAGMTAPPPRRCAWCWPACAAPRRRSAGTHWHAARAADGT